MKKRFLAIILLTAMLITSGATMLTISARASYWIDSYNITLSDRGSGVVRVTAHVCGTYSSLTQIGMPTIVLYEKANGTWKAIKTINSQYEYNSGFCSYQFDYQGVVGREYQAYASFMAKDGTGGDSRTLDSNSVALK